MIWRSMKSSRRLKEAGECIASYESPAPHGGIIAGLCCCCAAVKLARDLILVRCSVLTPFEVTPLKYQHLREAGRIPLLVTMPIRSQVLQHLDANNDLWTGTLSVSATKTVLFTIEMEIALDNYWMCLPSCPSNSNVCCTNARHRRRLFSLMVHFPRFPHFLPLRYQCASPLDPVFRL